MVNLIKLKDYRIVNLFKEIYSSIKAVGVEINSFEYIKMWVQTRIPCPFLAESVEIKSG